MRMADKAAVEIPLVKTIFLSLDCPFRFGSTGGSWPMNVGRFQTDNGCTELLTDVLIVEG